MELRSITVETLAAFAQALRAEERCTETIKQYTRSVRQFAAWLAPETVAAGSAGGWKAELLRRGLSPATVNSKLAGLNRFFRFLGWMDCTVKPLRLQRRLFRSPDRELSRAEYGRLLSAARGLGRERLGLLMEAICATGIRVSELRFITAEAVEKGYAQVDCKGKRRTVFLPEKLRRLIGIYMKKQKKTAGAVFITRSGRPLDRSNIWRDMKALCERAGVEPGKVFPHNLRHLFARTYYMLEKDLSRLADILGHTNVSTTRIYTAESGTVHARQMERMGLVIT